MCCNPCKVCVGVAGVIVNWYLVFEIENIRVEIKRSNLQIYYKHPGYLEQIICK